MTSAVRNVVAAGFSKNGSDGSQPGLPRSDLVCGSYKRARQN